MRRVAPLAVAAAGGWYLASRSTPDRNIRQFSRPSGDGQPPLPAAYHRIHTNAHWGRTDPIECEDGSLIELWSPPHRSDQVKRLETEDFDVLVIGGGATGAGVALDAVTRGLRTALVEREDFASGTSSRSTKLIHGGIRYLLLTFQKKMPDTFLDLFRNLTFNKANFDVVSSDLSERTYMIQSAPFMTRPLPMMVPIYKWWEVPVLWCGGKLYDAIAGLRSNVPASHYMTPAEAKYNFPTLKGTDAQGRSLKGCVVLYDGQMNDTRMNLHIALTAAQYGAAVVNHTEVKELLTEGKIGEPDYKVVGAEVVDRITGKPIKIRATQVINATGPFSDKIRKMADPEARNIIVPAQGAHLVLPDYFSPDRMGFVRLTSDGRVLYFLPWEGSTIAGTTDHRTEVVDHPTAKDEEIDFILQEANAVLNRKLTRENVRASWAGLRPLVLSQSNRDGATTKELAREHVIDVVRGGLISVCGGKWTTYRKMAEDGVDAAVSRNRDKWGPRPCSTHSVQLVGADRSGLVCAGDFDKVVVTLREQFDFSKDTARHLVSNYGTRSLQVAQIAQDLESTRVGSEPGDMPLDYRRLYSKYPMLEAEVVFATRHEYATSIIDVLARRTRLAFLDSEAASQCIPKVGKLMQQELGWDDKELSRQQADATAFLQTMTCPLRRGGSRHPH